MTEIKNAVGNATTTDIQPECPCKARARTRKRFLIGASILIVAGAIVGYVLYKRRTRIPA